MFSAPNLIRAAAKMCNVTYEQIMGVQRHASVVLPRWAVMWILHQRGWSYKMIGNAMNRDHTTVLHAVRMARERMRSDYVFKGVVKKLMEGIDEED